jgi:hypothetical protein
MDVLGWALIASMVLACATGLLASIEQMRFYRYLADRHVRLWISLGGPGLISAQSSQPRAASDFLMKRKYRDIDDAKLQLLGDQAIRMWIVFRWNAGVFALLFLALFVARRVIAEDLSS